MRETRQGQNQDCFESKKSAMRDKLEAGEEDNSSEKEDPMTAESGQEMLEMSKDEHASTEKEAKRPSI